MKYFSILLLCITLNAGCPFCDEAVLDKQKFYEDDFVYALYTHKPIIPSHFLIIPKRHVERLEELTDEEMLTIFHTLDKVQKASSKVFHTVSYFIHQKNGIEVGQSVPHLHFHLIGKEEGDDSDVKFAFNLLISQLKSALTPSEIEPTLEAMRSALSQ